MTSRTYTRNISGVVHNHHQHMELYPRVVTVCLGGCLRSPTAAVVLAQEPYNFNTRSVGYDKNWAITELDEIMLRWGEEFVVMDSNIAAYVQRELDDLEIERPIVNLNIPDSFAYRDPELMLLIANNYDEATGRVKHENT